MPVASILLAILSFGCAVLGFITTPIPVLGAVFSFAAPALAIAGAVVGGLAMSRAKRQGTSADVARTGVILSAIAFVPALLIAMFCGVCNALCSTGDVRFQKHVSFGVDPNGPGSSAGSHALPPPPRAAGAGAPPPSTPPASGVSPEPVAPEPEPGATPPAAAPPPAFPPPPLPAGPGQKSGR